MPSYRRLLLRWLPALLTVFVTGPLVRAQDRSVEELRSEVEGKMYREIIRDLLTGAVQPDAKVPEHSNALKAQTQYLTLRFVNPVYTNTPPNPPDKDKDKTLAYLITRVDIDLRLLRSDKVKTRAAAKLFTHHFVESAKFVIMKHERRNPVSSLNLVRAMENMAVLGQGELGEALADIIEADLEKDKFSEAERLKDLDKVPNDGVKYYALRALQKLLEQPPWPDMTPVLSKEQELKIVKVLQKVILTGQTFKDGTTPQEIDGFRVRRREAVKALAKVTNPAVPDKKDGSAMTLLRVVARDKALTPEPSIDERLEAAVGLARIKFDQDKDYNPDYAFYHIGFFLDEFVTYCNEEKTNTEKGGYQRPVRIYASRLIDALLSIKTQLDDPTIMRTDAEKKFVTDALTQYVLVLALLEKDGKVNPTGYKFKENWLAAAKAPNAQLFKGVAGTDVAVPAKKVKE